MKPQHAGLNALKVLMILFVIFIHENPTHNTHGDMVMWWNSIVVVAVPVFFVLSGFFFFRGMDVLTMDVYRKKLTTRFRTLFIPYMIWNCFPVLFVVAGILSPVTLLWDAEKLAAWLVTLSVPCHHELKYYYYMVFQL